MNTGKIKWKVPLGEFEELSKKGIAPTGTENYGGPVVTSGGLIFIAAIGYWLTSWAVEPWPFFALVGAGMVVYGATTALSIRITQWESASKIP